MKVLIFFLLGWLRLKMGVVNNARKKSVCVLVAFCIHNKIENV